MRKLGGPINDDYDVVVYAESEPSDAEHIAAFDPPTVLTLIARLREAEACIDAALDYAPDPTETGFETEAAMCRILSRYKTTKTEKEQDQ